MFGVVLLHNKFGAFPFERQSYLLMKKYSTVSHACLKLLRSTVCWSHIPVPLSLLLCASFANNAKINNGDIMIDAD